MITVYSTRTCPFCRMVENYLDSKGETYEKKLVGSQSAEEKANLEELQGKVGRVQGVPMTEIGGQFVRGFNRGAIDDLLAKMNH